DYLTVARIGVNHEFALVGRRRIEADLRGLRTDLEVEGHLAHARLDRARAIERLPAQPPAGIQDVHEELCARPVHGGIILERQGDAVAAELELATGPPRARRRHRRLAEGRLRVA